MCTQGARYCWNYLISLGSIVWIGPFVMSKYIECAGMGEFMVDMQVAMHGAPKVSEPAVHIAFYPFLLGSILLATILFLWVRFLTFRLWPVKNEGSMEDEGN